MAKFIWLVPLFPLLGFLVSGFFSRTLSKNLTGIIASGAVLLSFIVSLLIFIALPSGKESSITVDLFTWIQAGNLHIPFSFLVDPLSCIFLLIITGVGFLIHVYSIGYMHEDEGFNRFFSYLNLFVFFMLLLVLGSNYLILFVGWEGVGLCSYLLIGFWFKNKAYNNAANKAFIMNRIGDLGFLLGIILIYITFGSTSYADVFEKASQWGWLNNSPVITTITLLLFIGAIGKSAQLPLYTWLPDAMAGPTPVSALIHAATMVTAGIYMVVRSNILYSLAPISMEVVACVGIITALFAATIGLFQNDIKKVLAYSTVSQLGYMFLGLGVGAFTGSVFHVTTHAFFKALLFLGAGSVIHSMSGEQDIRRMGGLKKHLPITHFTFLIATLAISGIPPFSGFFSKDEILAHAYSHNKLFWMLGLTGSMLTAFYMFRLYYLTFHGEFRGTKDQLNHLHESPKSMTIPLMALAALSAAGGCIGFPESFHLPHLLQEFLSPVFESSNAIAISSHLSHETEYLLMGTAVALAGCIIFFARNYFVTKGNVPGEENGMSSLRKLVYNKYYVDELYSNAITKPLDWLSDKLYRFMDIKILDGMVNATGQFVDWSAKTLRHLQTGNVGFYLFAMVLSLLALLIFKFI